MIDENGNIFYRDAPIKIGDEERRALRWLLDLAEWTHCRYGRDTQLLAMKLLYKILEK